MTLENNIIKEFQDIIDKEKLPIFNFSIKTFFTDSSIVFFFSTPLYLHKKKAIEIWKKSIEEAKQRIKISKIRIAKINNKKPIELCDGIAKWNKRQNCYELYSDSWTLQEMLDEEISHMEYYIQDASKNLEEYWGSTWKDIVDSNTLVFQRQKYGIKISISPMLENEEISKEIMECQIEEVKDQIKDIGKKIKQSLPKEITLKLLEPLFKQKSSFYIMEA